MPKFKKPIAKRKDLILAKFTNEERGVGRKIVTKTEKATTVGINSKDKQYSGAVLVTR